MTTQDEGIFEMGKESGTSMAGGVGNVFRPQKEDEEVTGRLCLSRLVAYPVSALPLLLKPRNTSDSFAARSSHVMTFFTIRYKSLLVGCLESYCFPDK